MRRAVGFLRKFSDAADKDKVSTDRAYQLDAERRDIDIGTCSSDSSSVHYAAILPDTGWDEATNKVR